MNDEHHNKGNQYAAKPYNEKATSFLHIRVMPGDKAKWVKQAQRKGQKLSEWVVDKLNG